MRPRLPSHIRRAELEDYDIMGGAVGSWGYQTLARHRRPEREFPPGFHGANPGPSHDDPAPRPRAKQGKPPVKRRRG